MSKQRLSTCISRSKPIARAIDRQTHLYDALNNLAKRAFPRWTVKRIWAAFYPSGKTKEFHQDKGASTIRCFIPVTKSGADRALAVRAKGTTVPAKICYSPGQLFVATAQLLGAAPLADGQELCCSVG